MRGAHWYSVMPTWLLLFQAGTGQSPAEVGALIALTERIVKGDDRGWAARRAMERALELQARPDVPWMTEWGDLIEAGWQGRLVNEGEYQKYLERGVRISCRRSNLADLVPISEEGTLDVTPMIVVSAERVGWTTSVTVRVRLKEIRYGSRAVTPEQIEQEMLALGPGEVTMLLDSVEFEPEKAADQCTARFELAVRGSERADTDGSEATRAELRLSPEFAYPVPGHGR